MKRRYIAIAFSLIFILFCRNNDVSAVSSQLLQEGNEKIVGIETAFFFNELKRDYKEVFYVYFGRPTCPECIDFEEELKKHLENSGWIVYYYNTGYWKNDPLYDRILSDYHVDSVPVLVKISGGEFESAYLYEDGLSSVEVQEQLDEFFIPKSVGISAVTEKNYPIQFHDRIAAFIGILMLLNLVFLFVARKDWIKKEPRFALLTVFLNSTGLLGLQVLVFAIGIAFALEYEASPATDVLSRIGRSSYIATPVLYLVIAAVSVWIRRKQLKIKRQNVSENERDR